MLTVFVEAYNEEKTIGATLEGLIHQIDNNGNEVAKDLYRLVIILSKKSTDNSENIIKEYMDRYPQMEMYLIRDEGTGFVDARLCGINFVLNNLNDVTKYIALCDADLVVPDRWIYTILSVFDNTDNEVISFAGTFPTSFWKKVPKLTRKYYEEVGTVFFNRETEECFNLDDRCLFSEEIFSRFGRPVSGGCYAIRKDTYLANGGYKKEFRDPEQTLELDGPTWRMMFRLYRRQTKIYYYNESFFDCSERRMVADPQEFFSIKDYDKMNIMQNYRNVDDWMYERLNLMTDQIDFQPIRYYVTEYYVFLWCINNINLVIENKDFFGELYEGIIEDITQWGNKNQNPTSIQVFDFAHEMNTKYADRLIEIRRKVIDA